MKVYVARFDETETQYPIGVAFTVERAKELVERHIVTSHQEAYKRASYPAPDIGKVEWKEIDGELRAYARYSSFYAIDEFDVEDPS